MPVLTKDNIPGLPGWVFDILARLTSVDKINDLYDSASDFRGPDFASAVLQNIGVDYQIGNYERLSNLPEGPFITISNHPYGSIDGIMLVDLFGHLRSDFKVMVNKFLSIIERLNDNWITVVPTGNKKDGVKAESIQGVRSVLQNIHDGHPVGFFPSGAVSDFRFGEGIRDREWQIEVIRLIKKCHVPIIPVHFLDRNSAYFYALGLINWKLRVTRLPGELFNKKGKLTRIGVGEIITVDAQDSITDINEYGEMLRKAVYDMPEPAHFISRASFGPMLSGMHGHSSDAQNK